MEFYLQHHHNKSPILISGFYIFKIPAGKTGTKVVLSITYTEGTQVVVDNLVLEQVSTTPDDPDSHYEVFTNETDAVQTVNLAEDFYDVTGTLLPSGSSITLNPFSSQFVLFKGLSYQSLFSALYRHSSTLYVIANGKS